MNITTLIACFHILDNLGTAVFEQFVTVVEAGDARSIQDAIETGKVNPNAAEMIRQTLKDLVREVWNTDFDMRDELAALKEELEEALKEMKEAR